MKEKIKNILLYLKDPNNNMEIVFDVMAVFLILTFIDCLV